MTGPRCYCLDSGRYVTCAFGGSNIDSSGDSINRRSTDNATMSKKAMKL